MGITGLSFVQLDDDGSKPKKLVLAPGEISLIDMLPSFFDQIGNSGQDLLHDTGQAAKRLNKLLNDDNLEELSLTIVNLKTASGRIADLAAANCNQRSRSFLPSAPAPTKPWRAWIPCFLT